MVKKTLRASPSPLTTSRGAKMRVDGSVLLAETLRPEPQRPIECAAISPVLVQWPSLNEDGDNKGP